MGRMGSVVGVVITMNLMVVVMCMMMEGGEAHLPMHGLPLHELAAHELAAHGAAAHPVHGVAAHAAVHRAAAARAAAHEFACLSIKPAVMACRNYVKTGGNQVPLQCCNQVLALRNLVRVSIHTQRQACRCLVNYVTKNQHQINTTAYDNLPSMCGVTFSYSFNSNMNCDNLM